jgi:hypothetical protein
VLNSLAQPERIALRLHNSMQVQDVPCLAPTTKAALARGLCRSLDDAELLGCHFFGFAFLPHQFQFALGFLEGGSHSCESWMLR